MAVVENFIVPVIKGLIYTGMVMGIFYMIYKLLNMWITDFGFKMKYKVFRKKWNDDAVNWCMDAISKDMNEIKAEKFLLTKGTEPKKVKEIIFIFSQVKNKLQGGKKHEQLRQGNEQVKIPKI